jgi:hypothetical protein
MPSTAIRSIGYDDTSHRLKVTFVTGRVYVYDKVPRPVYEAFRTAPSRGRFFNFEIRDRYRFHEITGERANRQARERRPR